LDVPSGIKATQLIQAFPGFVSSIADCHDMIVAYLPIKFKANK
jgi:hypothetical protein